MVDAHYASAWSYVNALTGGAPDAEDILHQAFLFAFDTLLENDRTIRDMGKWLRGVIRNLVRAWWREKRRMPEELANRLYELAERADSLPDQLAQAELAATLENCLRQLAPAARRFVAARYEQGLRVQEIAAQEKINVNAARARLFRIRQTLRSCIESALPRGAS